MSRRAWTDRVHRLRARGWTLRELDYLRLIGDLKQPGTGDRTQATPSGQSDGREEA